MNFPFLKKETMGLRTQITFIGNKCEIYIPDYYFERSNPEISIAKEYGEFIETIGLFYFRADGKLYELQFPMRFKFQFSDRRKDKLKLKPEIPMMEYEVFELNRNDAFVYDILHKKSAEDFSKDFMSKIIENGKIPQNVSYEDIYQIYLNAMELTGFTNMGVSSLNIEMLISELIRNKKSMGEPFRKVYNKNNGYDYKMVRITKIPELNSTFTSLIGEDINNQLVSSILRHREGVKEEETPIERILKY